jgi:hypothetical protein
MDNMESFLAAVSFFSQVDGGILNLSKLFPLELEIGGVRIVLCIWQGCDLDLFGTQP